MSMLTGLKVSSLACICVFYKPERNAKRTGTPWNRILKSLNAEMKYTN